MIQFQPETVYSWQPRGDVPSEKTNCIVRFPNAAENQDKARTGPAPLPTCVCIVCRLWAVRVHLKDGPEEFWKLLNKFNLDFHPLKKILLHDTKDRI